MFDIEATIKWVTDVLKDPQGAAIAYKDLAAPWKQTFLQITLPVYAAGSVIAYIIALVTGGSFLFGEATLGFFLFGFLWSLAWTFVIAFIFDFFVGVFAEDRNFDAAYAVVGLAVIPAALGNAAAPLPWIGWLISLAAGVYSLMLAYRFIPVFLTLPEASRVKHFVVSVIAALLVNILVSITLGSMFGAAIMSVAAPGIDSRSNVGIFGGLERQASFAEAALNDTYDPPADGRLSKSQVERYIDIKKKTRTLTERLAEGLENLEEDGASVSDIFGGVGDVIRLSTAEMEVVKTAGGNWAEHQWIANQLEVARVQRDINDTVRHNFELFEEFRESIAQYD